MTLELLFQLQIPPLKYCPKVSEVSYGSRRVRTREETTFYKIGVLNIEFYAKNMQKHIWNRLLTNQMFQQQVRRQKHNLQNDLKS